MLAYFPEIYPNELLYSLLGRFRCHGGVLSPKRLLDDAFGSRSVRAGAFLQPCLGRLARNISPSRGLTAQRLALETTLLPYVTAYQPREVRDWALAALTGDNDDADALHVRLGLAASNIRLPSAMRYCPACRAEMLERHGELYWRRDHQLPGVLLCPIHGAPLADSRITPGRTGQHEFIAADVVNCPAKPAPPTWSGQPEAVKLLQGVSQASAALLATPPPARPLKAWGEEIRLALRSRGLGRGLAHMDQRALLEAFLARFGPILDILPGAAPDYWLEAITRKHRKAFAPLRHILIRLLIDSLPPVEAANPFGPGPWPCRNPLAEHHGQPVIMDCKLHQEEGKTIGVFRCFCGYAFSTAPQPGSRAKLLDLGPRFETQLRTLATTETSLRGTARALHVDPKTVLRYAARLGLETPWNVRPGNTKSSPIAREAMRAAWTEAHAAAPDMARQQLRRKIPALYAWLYRNDRDWLDAQPPAATVPHPGKPRFDWPSIDAAAAKALRQKATLLRAQSPPRRISRLALERALGQPGWLEKRLHKLPLCAIVLAEVEEGIDAYQRRRLTWAAEELRRRDLPIQAWRLRRLAALPSRCHPRVERMLRSKENQAA